MLVNNANHFKSFSELVDIWQVKVPDYSLSNIFNNTYFGRNRWFITNSYAIDPLSRFALRSTAPGFIELQWQTWRYNLPPWQNLLKYWTPQWLETQFGSPLASLQLLVDVADHLRMYSLLPLDAKSSTTTALLVSAESLLKWPAHYLTRLRQESVHPLGELRPQSELLWKQTQIRLEYLQRYATSLSLTQRLANELHRDLIQQLARLQAESSTEALLTTMEINPVRSWPPMTIWQPPSLLTLEDTQHPTEPPPAKRRVTAIEQMIADMLIRSKEYRYEEPYFIVKKGKK